MPAEFLCLGGFVGLGILLPGLVSWLFSSWICLFGFVVVSCGLVNLVYFELGVMVANTRLFSGILVFGFDFIAWYWLFGFWW